MGVAGEGSGAMPVAPSASTSSAASRPCKPSSRRYRHAWPMPGCRSAGVGGWKLPRVATPPIEELRGRGVLAVDLNHGQLAAVVLDRSGNPVGTPLTIPLEVVGLPATTRDGHLREAISQLLANARKSGCLAIAIEDLDFAQARSEGREHTGRRPSRGRRGRRFRALVAGIPTARFRDRLVQMAANRRDVQETR